MIGVSSPNTAIMEYVTRTEPEHIRRLREAVAHYKAEKARAAEIVRVASNDLADIVESLNKDYLMRKADILRAMDHEWSRTWVDRAVSGHRLGPPSEQVD